uniref:Uncharacterized protein n=1 Tax=Chlamydomonas euryale TaxID=1486919 RepID=A0A6U2DLM3_9CHLO
MPWDLHAVAFMSHLECGLDLCGKCFCNKSVGKVLGQNSGCKVAFSSFLASTKVPRMILCGNHLCWGTQVFDVHQATKLLASLTTLQVMAGLTRCFSPGRGST